jgi:hypothetical protein
MCKSNNSFFKQKKFFSAQFAKMLSVRTIPPILFVSGLLELIAYELGWFVRLKKPIHLEWFGANKTYRGIIVYPCICFLMSSLWFDGDLLFNMVSHGLLPGLFFNSAELINSFWKRRQNIEPGHTPNVFYYVLDHSDSTLGVIFYLFVYSCLFNVELEISLFLLFVTGVVLHMLFSALFRF